MTNQILEVQDYATKSQWRSLMILKKLNIIGINILIMMVAAFGILYWITLVSYLFGIKLPVVA